MLVVAPAIEHHLKPIVTVSDRTNRIVAITYYNDAATILEGLVFD